METKIASNKRGVANEVIIQLTNAAGIAYLPGQPFFIANTLASNIRVVDPAGFEEIPSIIADFGPGWPGIRANPSDAIANPTSGFELDGGLGGVPAQYLFANEDGTVSGWSEVDGDFLTTTVLGLDHSQRGDEYEGATLLTNGCCAPMLGLADFHHGMVRCVSDSFTDVECTGHFVDPHLPAGYAPFGIHQIENRVFVTYALQDAAKLHPVAGESKGIVDEFDWEGKFIRRFATGGTLNAPWGVVKASAKFGTYSSDILIGNFGDGTISAFDEKTGRLRGQLRDAAGELIVNPGLRGMVFGSAGTGNPNFLYFTAGPVNVPFGLLGSLAAGPEPTH